MERIKLLIVIKSFVNACIHLSFNFCFAIKTWFTIGFNKLSFYLLLAFKNIERNCSYRFGELCFFCRLLCTLENERKKWQRRRAKNRRGTEGEKRITYLHSFFSTSLFCPHILNFLCNKNKVIEKFIFRRKDYNRWHIKQL